VLNEAAEIGTNVHEWIEADLKGEFEPAVDSYECEQMVDQWLEWKAEHDIEPVLVEATGVNREHGYAGTLDGLWKVDGVPTLVDVKTSRNTWPEHFQQLAALGACYTVMEEVAEATADAVAFADTWWVETVMPAFSEYAILHLRPQDYDSKGNPTEAFCKLKPVSNIELHFEGFLGALQLKNYERKLKEMEG